LALIITDFLQSFFHQQSFIYMLNECLSEPYRNSFALLFMRVAVPGQKIRIVLTLHATHTLRPRFDFCLLDFAFADCGVAGVETW
jgi:hypothetical protein